MAVVKADPKLKAYLVAFTEETEIHNADRRVLGVFTPIDYSEARKLFDPEEIKRRKERSRNDPGRPLKEIVKDLKSLDRLQ